MKNLVKKIQNFNFKNDLWVEGSKIILAVSGGADSSCLLDVVCKIAPKYNLKLHVAHVNYGLRGKASDRDEKFVRDLAKKNGLSADVLKVRKKIENRNLENVLREIRYDFFEKLRKEKKFDLIAIAHNQDDQAETVLMRVLRGSGLQGISAMKSKTGKIIRPLLSSSREEILQYLKENKLDYQEDATNKDEKFLRNKIRHKLIPYLEKNYNKAIKNTLSEIASSVADDYELLKSEAKKSLKKIEKTETKNGIKFDINKFSKLHLALQRQALRLLILEVKNNLKNVEMSHIEEILKIIKSEKSKKQIMKFKGLKIERRGDRVNMIKL